MLARLPLNSETRMSSVPRYIMTFDAFQPQYIYLGVVTTTEMYFFTGATSLYATPSTYRRERPHNRQSELV